MYKDFFANASKNTHEVVVYTDGACSKNPGAGGWGAVILLNEDKLTLSGGEELTTNNRMEMLAAIEALACIYQYNPSLKVSLYTDSKYLKDGICSWIDKWKKNNWYTSTKKPVKNKDLWEQVDELIQKMNVTWNWVPGHAGVEYNEEADMLARKAIIAQNLTLGQKHG